MDQAKISLLRKIYQKDSPYNVNEFLHGITEQDKGNYLQALLQVDAASLVEAATKILKFMADGTTSQVIFGTNTKGLDELVKRGWLIERVIDDISVKPE